HVSCGSVITQNTTLDSDIGPCPGDGLVVTASNITLDLNQRRIFAANGAGDNAGIRLLNVTGVTVMNGTVEGFDAGVFILNGSGNVVRGMTVRNNINDMIPTPQGTPNPCDLGDGIAVQNADNNSIDGNLVVNNGPFGGISLVEDSDGNQIRGNTVQDHKVRGVSGGGCGNNNQDEGIRIEGPGANNNRVLGNNVSRSNLAGIGVHGHVGCEAQGGPPLVGQSPEPPNSDNTINGNVVTATADTSESDGIKILDQGPFGTVVCAAFRLTINGNNSSNNARHGIMVPGTSINNTINGNVVNGNLGDGIRLDGAVFQNRFTNVGPTLLDLVSPDRAPYVQGTDYRVMSGSGSGDVTARLVPIDIVPGVTGTTNPNPPDTSTSG
ncbi:MAG: right-handed parallel beta-helix repeat-containing protein, partial [Actinobacteria bacterium]|nr:right-handed parallel beta-helix repeat-containing protein [Actinomycetota bacterium]